MNTDSCGKAKMVVSKLVKSWRQLNSAECNMTFFSNLLSKNICTRDIHSFILKQAGLRKSIKQLDIPLSKKAMKSKLSDACSFALKQRRMVGNLKRELLQAVGRKRYTHRRIIKQLRDKFSAEKKCQEEKDLEKVQRYLSIQSQMMKQTDENMHSIPASIQFSISIIWLDFRIELNKLNSVSV